MPADACVACIVLLHLDSEHDSTLIQMLAEWTALTVIEGVDGTVIQQGYVYVTPSRNLTSVRHGKLQVHQGGYQQHHLIDFLFHSVAADLGAKAVGIIFSGHLNDGASGLAAIRGNGGLGLVQEPATAEFDCMPLSAIEAGGADKIAAPARMPELILNFNRALKSIAKNVKVHDGHTNKILEAILDLLSRSEDRSYLGYKKTTLLRRIERRMSLCLLDDLHRYLEKLRNNPVELKQLAADLLIGVTAFFRDPKAFQVLETEVIPEIFSKNQPGRPIRAWIAGCSTGQEAYSVALQLYEYRRQAGLSQAIVIFATDINETALDEARRGCFSRDSVMSQVPDALIERYFVADPHGFSICNEIRELLIFAPHNLLCDPPFFRLDLIICRNVFIYMEPEIQNRLLAVFRFALNEQGYLFLGSSEAIGIQAHHFKVISKQWRIFRNLHNNPGADLAIPGAYKPKFVPFAGNSPGAIRNDRFFRRLLEQNGPAFVLINQQQEVLFTGGTASKYLSLPNGELSNDLNLMLKTDLLCRVRTLIGKAQDTPSQLAFVGHCRSPGCVVRVTARSLQNAYQGALYLLTFDEEAVETSSPLAIVEYDRPVVEELEHELQAARDDLFFTIEQLRALNEEQKTVNKEILALNEELHASNEALGACRTINLTA